MSVVRWLLWCCVGLACGCAVGELRDAPWPGDSVGADADPPAAVCGDGVAAGNEVCDGPDLRHTTCEMRRRGPGVLACVADCSGFDVSGCGVILCGNAQLDAGEECDGAALGVADCQALGLGNGTPACFDNCRYDTRPCVPRPPDVSAELYDPNHVPRFDLEISEAAMAALEAAPDVYAPATLRYKNTRLDNVGVRLKGEYTFRPLTQKASFKLKLDAFVADQRLLGLKRLTLNNAIEDPSFIAERLTYDAFRAAALPAPRCNNAEVYVNGEWFGLYVNVETEDKTFLARWFANNDGNLYEEQGAEFLPGNEDGFELETNEVANDRSDLTGLFAAVATLDTADFFEALEPVLDTTAFLRYAAMEGLVNQWDGYAYTEWGPNNFRVYHDPQSHKFFFLPWGMDMSLKPSAGDFVDLRVPRGLILQRCFEQPVCLTKYRETLVALTEQFEALGLAAKAETYANQVRALAYADPRKEIDNGAIDSAQATVMQNVQERPGVARGQLP